MHRTNQTTSIYCIPTNGSVIEHALYGVPKDDYQFKCITDFNKPPLTF